MFPGQSFSAPFFIQYGPGNTQTVDGGDKYLYAVSNDGYAYNGNYLHLARVPLRPGPDGQRVAVLPRSRRAAPVSWTSSPAGATRVLQARHGLSQPAIQYVPALKRYVLTTFYYTAAGSTFPTLQRDAVHATSASTPRRSRGDRGRTSIDHATQRSLWCTASPVPAHPGPGLARR